MEVSYITPRKVSFHTQYIDPIKQTGSGLNNAIFQVKENIDFFYIFESLHDVWFLLSSGSPQPSDVVVDKEVINI